MKVWEVIKNANCCFDNEVKTAKQVFDRSTTFPNPDDECCGFGKGITHQNKDYMSCDYRWWFEQDANKETIRYKGDDV